MAEERLKVKRLVLSLNLGLPDSGLTQKNTASIKSTREALTQPKFATEPGPIPLEAQDPPGSAEVELTLTGVQNITLDHLNYGDWLALKIEDISDRGWDRVHFEITALDQSDFKIYCRQVKIKYLQDPSRPG